MSLPAGLALHCATCGIVVPSDAPLPPLADCAWVARNKMAPFHPNESLRGQHAAAVAAWHMIHHRSINGPTPHADAVAYLRQFKHAPVAHFAASVARQSLTTDQLSQQRLIHPKRDAGFFA